MKYLRHLKEVHDVMVLDLVLQETELDLELGDLFNFKEFCVKQRDAMLDHLIEKWEAPVVVMPHRQLEPELVQLEDSLDEVGNEEEEISIESESQDGEVEATNCAEDENQKSEKIEEVFSQEKESDRICDVNVGNCKFSQMRKRGEVECEEESEFTCQICDQTFLQGLAVSLHMFKEHLRGLTSVWEPLVKPASPAAFPHSWTCVLCSDTFPTRATAQLHIYTESQHKRRLKHSMEDRGENWQHTLEFVRFKIPVDKVSEEEDDDHAVGDEAVTSSSVETREVTAGSVEAVEKAEPGEVERTAKDPPTVSAAELGVIPAKGEEAFKLDPGPDHLELDYEPEDEEDNNNEDVIVNKSIRPSSVQNEEVKDGNENMTTTTQAGAGDEVKERESKNRVNIVSRVEQDEGLGQGISCSHARGGCPEVFPSMIELHSHARKCQYRPATSFHCSTHGCGKRWDLYRDNRFSQ